MGLGDRLLDHRGDHGQDQRIGLGGPVVVAAVIVVVPLLGMSGQRRHQVVPCPNCSRRVFILPHSPLDVRGEEAAFQNKIHLALEAAGFGKDGSA